jgi:NodT family efflux transporter outer membrane factor (OMF) lipoprotein
MLLPEGSRFVRIRRSAALVLSAGLLSACAVGPDYREPPLPARDEWQSQPQTGASADAATLASWWTALNDPTLNQLVERAVAENKTVKQAVSRVIESRARRSITAAGFFPTISSSAGGSHTDSDSSGLGSGSDADSFGAGARESYSSGLDAGWELDLFGGTRRSLEASTAQLAASEADLRDVLVTLLGDVALSYVSVRTTQSRLNFAERSLQSQREVMDITGWRAQAGLATELDVEQAKANYAQTRAQIPSLESNLAAAKNRLAVLTGEQPGALSQVLDERKPIPVAPADIISSVPADVVRRRPDVRSAERRLAAQTAQVGVATAALYPSLSLSGSIGVSAASAGDLVSDNFGTTRYGLSLSMPIFRAGALRQNINAQNALVDQALASYEATVLGVYEEVENALTAWVNEQRRHEALIEAVSSARLAYDLSVVQYNSGLVDFQTVLTADRQLITTEDALAVSDGEITSNLVRLYKALGGGWSVFPSTTALSR